MLTEIFYHVDEFCKLLNQNVGAIVHGKSTKKRYKSSKMTLSEVITVMIYFHHSGYRTFKDYYLKEVKVHLTAEFKNLVSYNRFIELKKEAILPLLMFMRASFKNKCTGISYIDSFSLKVCHNRRISSHKGLKMFAQRGKTSVGWFFGVKLHLIINQYGEFVDIVFSKGNASDANRTILECITKYVKGKLFGDKGYIVRRETVELLQNRGIALIKRLKKNMPNQLLTVDDKMLLQKKSLIETVG